MLRVLRVPVSVLAALVLTAAAAAAHGHGGHGGGGHGGGHPGGFHHGGGFHHFHGGFHHFHGGFFFQPYDPFWFGPAYWPPPAPYYGYAPALTGVPVPGQCRVFQGDAVIAGTNQPFYGTACWQSDGMWHIMP